MGTSKGPFDTVKVREEYADDRSVYANTIRSLCDEIEALQVRVRDLVISNYVYLGNTEAKSKLVTAMTEGIKLRLEPTQPKAEDRT